MTKTFIITGFAYDLTPDKEGIEVRDFTVRYTADQIGKSLSIADEKRGLMFHIPIDELLKIITEGEK